jgi:hypothetical protein
MFQIPHELSVVTYFAAFIRPARAPGGEE